jgi:hypothetical protein
MNEKRARRKIFVRLTQVAESKGWKERWKSKYIRLMY